MKNILTIILLIAAPAVFGQTHIMGISYEMNFPNNDNYLTKASFRGGKFEYRHVFPNKKFSVGIAMNWATYEEYFPRQTFENESGETAVTGDFLAQTYQIPITALFHYYFKGGKTLKPFAGIGLGAQSLMQSIYYNVYVSEDNNWGFVARPELGVIWTPSNFGDWGILLGAGYSYSTNKTEFVNNSSFKNFGINIGFVFGQ